MKSTPRKKRLLPVLLIAAFSVIVVVGITLSLPFVLFNINTMHTVSNFSFTDGYARVNADYIGYEDTAEIQINVKIERKKFLFRYEEIVNESYTSQGSSYQNEFFYPIDKNGTYRCTVTYTVTSPDGNDIVTFRDVKVYRADEYSSHTHTPGDILTVTDPSSPNKSYLRQSCTVCGEVLSETLIVESSKGLAYQIHPNRKTCTITGIGSCTDTDIVIGTHIDGYRITDIAEKAFSYCHSITSVEISDGITKIGKSAFFTCSSLTKISLPSTLTVIENSLLFDCRKLTTVFIPEGAQSIEKMAFAYCASLKEISLPDSIRTIGNSAFNNSALERIKLPSNLTVIEESAFSSCDYLLQIVIPNQVTTIGEKAFSHCYMLESVTLSESLTEIGERAFGSCRSLKKITIPESMTEIDSYVFTYCESLEEVTLPDTLYRISRGAFENCTSLKTITLPQKLAYITREAFYQSGIQRILYNGTNIEWDLINKDTGWDKRMPDYTIVYLKGEEHNFSYTVNEDGATCTITKMGSRSNTILAIPETIDGYRVTAIGESVFWRQDQLKTVILPDSIQKIGFLAFGQCTNLEEIVLPNGLTYIETGAFTGCENLTSITIPNTVYYIGDAAFESCKKLKSIVIPDSVTDLLQGAFENCHSLETVSIGKGLTNMGKFVFRNCYNITSFNVNAENTAYTAIDGNLYTKDASTLICYAVAKTSRRFIIPETVTKIEEAAFEFATNLRSVSVPASVTEIGACAFLSCYNLVEIEILGSLTEISDKTFYNCFELTAIRIPDSVAVIGDSVFANCSKLQNVQMPDGVQTIGQSAFADCVSLKSILIGSGVQKIGSHAFNGCSFMTEFRYNGTAEEWGKIEIGDYWDSYIISYTVVFLA